MKHVASLSGARRWSLLMGGPVFLLGFAIPAKAQIWLLDNFNNDTRFTKHENVTSLLNNGAAGNFFFRDNANEYWGIRDPVGSTSDFDAGSTSINAPNYTGFSGNYMVAEALDGGPTATPYALVWSGLNVAGVSSLTFHGLFAASIGTWDTDNATAGTDFIHVQYRFNGTGNFQDLIWFSDNTSGTGAGTTLARDSNFDNFGEGTALGLAAGSFSQVIPGTGNTLDIRIVTSSRNASGTEFAFDSFFIAVPEPSTYGVAAAAGLAAIIVGRRRRTRKAPTGA